MTAVNRAPNHARKVGNLWEDCRFTKCLLAIRKHDVVGHKVLHEPLNAVMDAFPDCWLRNSVSVGFEPEKRVCGQIDYKNHDSLLSGQRLPISRSTRWQRVTNIWHNGVKCCWKQRSSQIGKLAIWQIQNTRIFKIGESSANIWRLEKTMKRPNRNRDSETRVVIYLHNSRVIIMIIVYCAKRIYIWSWSFDIQLKVQGLHFCV